LGIILNKTLNYHPFLRNENVIKPIFSANQAFQWKEETVMAEPTFPLRKVNNRLVPAGQLVGSILRFNGEERSIGTHDEKYENTLIVKK